MAKKSNNAVAAAAVALAASSNSNAEVISTPAAATKADKARAIFTECYAMDQVPQRKDIIARAVTEAGLTKPGAATYLQNFKRKAGLVAVKQTAVPA